MPTMRTILDPLSAWLARRAGPIAWALALATIVLMPFLILAMGYLPLDDCLRHAAKAVDGRPWSEILVLRPGLMADPNAAWHGLLRGLHLLTGAGPEALALIAVLVLCLLVLLAPLPWMEAPEAWIGAWALLIATGGPIGRLVIGRPLLVNMAALLAVMALWTRSDPAAKPSARRLAGTTLLMGIAGLLHGSWYLLCLIPAAFFLAGRIRDGLLLSACWAVGSFLAGAATGHPLDFLGGQLLHMSHALGNVSSPSLVVPELRPSGGGGLLALACLGAVALKVIQDRKPERLLADPLFMLALLGWVLGLRIQRFWGDWGLPCAALWLAFEAEPLLLRFGRRLPLRRVELAAGLCLAFLFMTTANAGGRWSPPQGKSYLTQDRPELAGWLPEPGGIIYAEGMDCFFDSFFRNPGAPWRYMVGFESSMMPPADQLVFRDLCRGDSFAQAMAPWIARMRPADRMVIRVSWKQGPNIPELEWKNAGGDLWIGRTRRR